jgi:P27 family predicted phage terminase small subunit
VRAAAFAKTWPSADFDKEISDGCKTQQNQRRLHFESVPSDEQCSQDSTKGQHVIRADFSATEQARPLLHQNWPLAVRPMPANRKDQALHDLHSTKPHSRASDLSHVPSGRPRFPKDLDATLKPIFKRLCSLLQERRTLTRADAELLRLYCFQYERHEKNVALLRVEGELCEYTRLDSHGKPHQQVKLNLRLKVVSDAERQMAAILNQLGLTPTAKDRARPAKLADDEKPVDLMEQYLRGEPIVFRNNTPEEKVNPADMTFDDLTEETT